MHYFEKTAEALENIEGQFRYIPGEHPGSEIRPGWSGQNVGDVMYDPEEHEREDINPLSPWQGAYGRPCVTYTMPEQPLGIDLVVHIGERNDHSGIVRAKQILGTRILEAIKETTGWMDRVNTYIIGMPDEDIGDAGAEIIDEELDDHAAATTVADLCRSGLAIVISDFANLPLVQADPIQARAAVGVQINYKLFEEVLPDMGIISLGSGREVMVSDGRTGRLRKLLGHKNTSAQVTPVTDAISSYQLKLRHDAEAAGLTMARALFDHTLYDAHDPRKSGFDEVGVDAAIATAIATATEQ